LIAAGENDVGKILELQNYRLCHWSLASEEINYRRFFAVSDLVGVRVEDPMVYEETHRKINQVVEAGPVDGLRVDHPDGLRDPKNYFQRLRKQHPDLWIAAEKILEPGEELPQEWPIQGTTGYDFLQMVGGLWIAPTGEKAITDFCGDFTGQSAPYGEIVREQKRRIIRDLFAGDVEGLVDLLRSVCDERKLDYPRSTLRNLLTELIAGFPVYRTYVQPERSEISDADCQAIACALSGCRRREEDFDPIILELTEEILTGKCNAADGLEFLARFQQVTGAIMAKGVEDTAFYRYDRLIALNEVGCDPARFGISPESFHEHNITAHERWPLRMLSTSTHDTKRSEDVRCRISLLSEIPEQWADEVRKWSQHNLNAWAGREPDRSAEHLFYQTLVGAWPIETQRVRDYMRKAYREAGRFTSWNAPNQAYERRMDEFIETVLNDDDFLVSLQRFIEPLVYPGRVNSLSQTLLKLTSPGVPDIYQGCEVWDNSLVDPDNRRSVDLERRIALLKRVESLASPEDIMEGIDEGLPKLYLIWQTLELRKRKPKAFQAGSAGVYKPLLAAGSKLGHVVAFSRGQDVAVVVPRLLLGLNDNWDGTTVALGAGIWRDAFDGQTWTGEVELGKLFARFPVAILERT
jgi:(1->4)-alpha-D-glucan 1-alpha-D-glucosylmutase